MSNYKIWDNVRQPIGIIYVVSKNDNQPSDEFMDTMRDNGYIIVMGESQHSQILQDIQMLYKLPIIVFGYGKHCHAVRSLVARCELCKAGICVSKTDYEPRIIQWLKSMWGTTESNKPMLEISCGLNAINNGCTLAQSLYRNHREQDIHKTTFIIYPDATAQYDTPDVQRDTLEFLNEISWQ